MVNSFCGYLRDRGIYVQLHRVRGSVARTDPVRTAFRWQQVISRCSYNVEKSNGISMDTIVLFNGGLWCMVGFPQLLFTYHVQLIMKLKQFTTFSRKQFMSMVVPVMYDLTKVGKMLWCVGIWLLHVEQEEQVTYSRFVSSQSTN